MHQDVTPASQPLPARGQKKALSRRIPRMGKVIFEENGTPVHCAVKELTDNSAVLTMTGWLGLPSNFTLFIEPDSIKAECRIILRKGSNIRVEFVRVEEGIRYRVA